MKRRILPHHHHTITTPSPHHHHTITTPSPHHHHASHTIRLPSHKLAVRTALTPTNAGIWITNTTCTLAVTLAPIAPEESPVIRISSHFVGGSRRGASVGLAGPVGGAVDGIVLVVCFEDGEGLGLVGARVVAAFGGLDGVAGCRGGAARGRWVEAFAVRGRGLERGGCEGQGEGEWEESGEEHGV
jgi:hypothetical protein